MIEEQLHIEKRPVQRGGVRVYRRMSEQPVAQQVNLREERIRVDRRPADRPATEADLRPADQVIAVTAMGEEAVIRKEARVVEEVVVGKESRQRTKILRDKVKRSDVNVEQLNRDAVPESAGTVTDYEDDFRRDRLYKDKLNQVCCVEHQPSPPEPSRDGAVQRDDVMCSIAGANFELCSSPDVVIGIMSGSLLERVSYLVPVADDLRGRSGGSVRYVRILSSSLHR